MKKKVLSCLLCFLLLLTSSCAFEQSKDISSTGETTSSSSGDPDGFATSIKRYDVYQQGAMGQKLDRFSAAMADNPITERMNNELRSDGPGTTWDFVVFYGDYLSVWKDELVFSIDNFKIYLSDDEIVLFDIAQEDWEKSLYSYFDFDMQVLGDHNIALGSQQSYGRTIYILNQYSDRAIHIKYMTYLIENSSTPPVPELDQLWNTFHEF